MTIIEKEKRSSICFGDIKNGEIFEYDKTYWMKIFNRFHGVYCAVNIYNGEVCEEFELADMCKAVKSELHILY